MFASTDDLAARLGITLTDDEETRAETLLTLATELIQDEAKQEIDLHEDDVLELRGTRDERILLPERPVVSVASVVLDGVELAEGGSWILNGNEIARLGWETYAFIGVSTDIGGGFGIESQALTITYTHGYAEIPAAVKSICLEAVVRVWVNPGSVVEERIGNEEVTYAPYASPPRGLMLTDSELQVLRRKFGRQAKSITIGG